MKRFGDFADDTILAGNKVKIEDVLNTEVAILDFSVKTSKHNEGNYLTIQVEVDNEKRVIFTGSGVLIDQLEKYKGELPFLATIRKVNKYYSLT